MRSPDQIGITWEENQLLMQQLREKAALENRRQHNIFEVGDKVVIKAEPFWPEDYIIQTVGQEHIGKWYMAAWKHATDAEIKAGKRLEVK